VVSVSPGLVDTDFVKGLDRSGATKQVARRRSSVSPRRRDRRRDAGRRHHFRYSTGCIFPVDGGRRWPDRATFLVAESNSLYNDVILDNIRNARISANSAMPTARRRV